MILELELSTENKYKQVKMIHTQFGHASKDNMFIILQNANLLNSDIKLIVKKVVNSCETSENHRHNLLLHF